ncbi:MAG: hypothetical protein BMS9Abin07_0065 [Acidimicrobiia bacterium]|nr:MAG: hypothetical protein BMS9Abin07_0065 [Acidimicrobiia bacterium]
MDTGAPIGPISVLFTDIEGSSRLWETHPGAMETALAVHDTIVRDAVIGAGGTVVKGTGDGFMAVFPSPIDAAAAAVAAQLSLQNADFDAVEGLLVRMGIHVGEARPREGDYYGPAINRAARLMGVGHGGQILVSSAFRTVTTDGLPSAVSLKGLGEHRLRDLTAPEQVYQLLHPELRAEFPPLTSLDSFPNNLPSTLQSFVGRKEDIARITDTLGGARLVTLTGPGGTGKTRLAAEVAAAAVRDFPWGAWLVDLAPLADPALVPSAIAESIGIAPQPGRSVVETLITRLTDRGMLIILDSCEHLLEAAAGTTRQLLENCPTVKIVATSRERLGLAGEHVFVVKPLSWPTTTDPTAEALLAYEAAELFADRAREANSDWVLDDVSAPHVARICAAVEGIPLAIELAAARTRVLTVAQIADRLDQQLALLGGYSGGEDRHHALRATIDWSYDLMSDEERRLFRRLSVFRGGADFEAIEATAEAEDTLLDALDGLVSKSMILAEEAPSGMRYRLLEPLRQYAADQLTDQGEEAGAFAQHWTWFDRFARDSERGVRGPDQLEWLARTEIDYDNLRAALSRAYEADEIGTCMSLAGSLSWFMFLHSHIQDWDLWLPRLLDRGHTAEPRMLARLLLSAAQYAWELARMEEAETHATRALDLAEAMGSDTLQAWAHTYLALIGILGLNIAMADDHLDSAEPIFQGKGNLAGIGYVMWVRAFVGLLRLGDDEATTTEDSWVLETMQIVVEGARRRGDRNLLGHTLWTSAEVARLGGDTETAWAQNAEASAALYELGNHYCLAHNLLSAAGIALSGDEVAKAATLLSASHSLKERLGVTGPPLEIEWSERVRADIEQHLDEAAFAEAWEQGQRLAIAAVVGLATKSLRKDSSTPS